MSLVFISIQMVYKIMGQFNIFKRSARLAFETMGIHFDSSVKSKFNLKLLLREF